MECSSPTRGAIELHLSFASSSRRAHPWALLDAMFFGDEPAMDCRLSPAGRAAAISYWTEAVCVIDSPAAAFPWNVLRRRACDQAASLDSGSGRWRLILD